MFCCCPELTEGCLESPNGDLEVKLDDNELVEPFNKHLGDNLTSVAIGESLGIVIDLELEASIFVLFCFEGAPVTLIYFT